MKNFIAILRKYSVAMVMNFVGLVLAFTAFMALMLQVEYQQSFDKNHPTSGCIYRVDKVGSAKDDVFRNVIPRGYADDIIGSSPHILAATVSCPFIEPEVIYAHIDDNHPVVTFRFQTDVIYPSMFEVFGVEFTEGNANALKDLSVVAIPQSLALKLYGKESALGKVITKTNLYGNKGDSGKFTIGAVYKDFPPNSQMRNCIYINLGNFLEGNYGGANFVCYLLLDSPESKLLVEENFNSKFNYPENSDWLTDIELTPIEEIYFEDLGNQIYKTGSRSQMWLLICISILVMFIGGINYSTFFTALAPMRVKSINTQKILGSPLFTLRKNLIMEAMAFCLCAFGVSLCLIEYVSQWLYSQELLEMAFNFADQIPLVMLSAAIAVVLGLCAGIYPSFYVTSLPPAFALKGNFALSLSGRKFRTTMMLLQYIISFALLMFVFSIYKQNNYMLSYDNGFDKDRVFVAKLSQMHAAEKSDWLRERMRSLPEVEDVAYALECMGGKDTYSITTFPLNGEDVRTFVVYCSYNFLDVMGIEVVDGRNFSESDRYVGPGVAIMNQKLKDLGHNLDKTVVGQSGPVRINSLRSEGAPLLYMVLPDGFAALDYAYIRLSNGVDKADALKKIKEVFKEMDPDYPFEIWEYDVILGELYAYEIMQGKIISIFSLLAAVLSLIGVFGQVLLDVQYSRRDIAVRKVYGEQTSGLIKYGLRRYVILVTAAFMIVVPVACYIILKWQESFVERTGISLLTFVVPFCAVIVMTMAIVAFQYWRASSINPAEILQKE